MNRFQRILVPLDGSLRAERALPLAARIARASGGSLILLRVIEAMPEQKTTVTSASALEKKRVSAQLDDAQQIPPQPERAQWMDEHRKNAMFADCDLPLLFVPVPAQGQVGVTK